VQRSAVVRRADFLFLIVSHAQAYILDDINVSTGACTIISKSSFFAVLEQWLIYSSFVNLIVYINSWLSVSTLFTGDLLLMYGSFITTSSV